MKMRYLPRIAAGLLALSSSTSAAPTAESTNSTSQAPSSLNNELIFPSQFDLISFYSQLAAASYCPANFEGTQSILTCSAGNCDDVQKRSFLTTLKFPSAGVGQVTNTAGFVAVDNNSLNRLVAVSFRGTQDFQGVVTNLDLGLVPMGDICPGCLGHSGFYRAWQDVRTGVSAAVAAAVGINRTTRVVVTGHSLGAAIASIAAVDLRNQGFTVDLANYGSPRVGNGVFAVAANPSITTMPPKLGSNFRVVHQGVDPLLSGDPIPTVPFQRLQLNGNYEHILPGLALAQTIPDAPANAGEASEIVKDIDISDETFFTLALNNFDGWHNNYFGPIAKCGNTSVFDVVRQPANFVRFKEIVRLLAIRFPNDLFTQIVANLDLTLFPTPSNLRIPLAIVA